MKRSILILASLLALFISCNKESADPQEPSEKLHYTLTIGLPDDDVKATFDESRKMCWNTGDQISVNGKVSDPLDAKYDGQNKAEFTFEEHPYGGAPYLVCYGCTYTDASHIVLPYEQTGAGGADEAKNFPMAARIESEEGLSEDNLVLYQLCGFINTKITGSSSSLRFVELYAGENDQLSGSFGISFNSDGVPTLKADGISSSLDRKVRVNCTAALSGTESNCIIAVPAGTYASSTLRFITGTGVTNGKYIESASSSSKTITRGSIKNFTAAFDTSNPTGDYVEITSADDWNTFASAFNEGSITDASTLIVGISKDLDFSSENITTLTEPFSGKIDGNNCSFKNVELTNKAILANLGSGGVVKNIKIGAGSKLTVDGNESSTYYAPLVADLQGSLENCESAADVDFVASHTDDAYFIGGLAGRVRSGSIKDCNVSGILKDTEVETLTSYSYIGGIAGDINRFDESSSDGSISGCEFSGKILMGPDAGTSETGVTGITCNNTTGFRIGGIAGRSQNASVSDCSTTSDAVLDIRGDMLVVYCGGIIANAQTSVTGCTNAADISVWSKSTDESNGNACVGGIAGSSSAEIKTCGNSGALNMYAQHRSSYWGGIVGSNTGKVSGCTNSGAVTEQTYRPRYLYFGGVIGKNANAEVTDVHNNAAVSVGCIPVNSGMGRTYCGGIIGWNTADLDGSTIDNSGAVSVTITKTTYLQVAVGGVIGCNQASLSEATNTGTVQASCAVRVTSSSFTALGGVIGAQMNGVTAAIVSNCTNTSSEATDEFVFGKVTSTDDQEDSPSCLNWCEGGIIGYIDNASLTVTNCENNAQVHHQENLANGYGRSSFTGGIIGRAIVSDQPLSIESCTNKGRCYGQNWNNATTIAKGGPFLGGIIGSAEGASDNVITIQSCKTINDSGATASDVFIYSLRGITGGIAGHSSYVTIGSCTVSKQISNNSNATYIGGMVGQAYNTTISGGTVSSNPINTGKNIGGIVSVLGTGSSITGSAFSGAITNAGTATGYYRGAIAASSASGTTITNAVVTGSSVNGTSATASDTYVCGDNKGTIYGTVCK